jgi:serine/threonine protein kinase
VTGSLEIVDVGLAKIGDAGITRDGTVAGTFNYMSPELLSGSAPVDHRSDVFSAGAVFHELLCGRKAFPEDFGNGLFARITAEEPEPLNLIRPDLPPAVCRVVARALQKRPANRYQDLSTMAREIDQIRERIDRIEIENPTVEVFARGT